MLTITNETGFIVFNWNSNKIINVDKNEIRSITKKLPNELQINSGSPSRFYPGGFKIKWTDVTSPVTANLTDLETILKAYAQNPQSTPEAFTVNLTAGTNVVSIPVPMTTTTYKILWVCNTGFDTPSLLNYDNFTVTNVLADCTATFVLFY